MKNLFLLSTAILSLTVADGQTTFQKTYDVDSGDVATDVQQTNDGGYVITGYTHYYWDSLFNESPTDAFLIKTNSNGDTLWTKIFGSDSIETINSVRQTTDNGYILAGYRINSGQSDIYLIKTNSIGDTLWTKSYGNAHAKAILQTTDTGYIIAGSKNVSPYLIKTNSTGDTLWTRIYGGINGANAQSVQQTNDGGYILAGFANPGAGPGPFWNIFLIKTNSNGNILWQKMIGNTIENYTGMSIQQTFDGGFFIAGSKISSGGTTEAAYLLKTDSLGNPTWAKTYGGGSYDAALSAIQTTDSGYVFVGYTFSTTGYNQTYLVRTTSNGDTLWTRVFYNQPTISINIGYSIKQTTDGGFVIAGVSVDPQAATPSSDNVYLIKTDANGNTNGCSLTSSNTTVSNVVALTTVPPTQTTSGGSISNTVTMTRNGVIVNTLCMTVGINEMTRFPQNNIIYPNPFSTQTTLQTEKTLKNATLTIYSCFGLLVGQIKNLNGQTVTLYRDNLASGLYFIRLTEENKTIAVEKLVITDK